jgi:hypothetical protein
MQGKDAKYKLGIVCAKFGIRSIFRDNLRVLLVCSCRVQSKNLRVLGCVLTSFQDRGWNYNFVIVSRLKWISTFQTAPQNDRWFAHTISKPAITAGLLVPNKTVKSHHHCRHRCLELAVVVCFHNRFLVAEWYISQHCRSDILSRTVSQHLWNKSASAVLNWQWWYAFTIVIDSLLLHATKFDKNNCTALR